MKTLEAPENNHNFARRKSYKPLLEDALQVLKRPLHNPEAKDFKNIMYVMKNCYFFRKNFSSQIALNEFVEFAKFYAGYEVHKYGTVLLRDREYADKLCIILDGTVDKIFQKPYAEVEAQIQDKRRRASFCGFNTTSSHSSSLFPKIDSPLHFHGLPMKSEERQITSKIPLQTQTRLRADDDRQVNSPMINTISPSSIKKSHVLKTSESPITEEDETTSSLCLSKKLSTLRANHPKMVQRHFSQQCLIKKPSAQVPSSEYSPEFENLIKFITSKDSEVKKKYFPEDILRANKVKTYITGEYFGETFCIPNYPKSSFMYAVSSPEVHLLTFQREDYQGVLKQLEHKNHQKLEAFLTLFPLFDRDYVQRFSQHFYQRSFQVDEIIYFEGSPAQDFFILQSGEVQLLKKLENSNDNHHVYSHSHSGKDSTSRPSSLLPITSVIRDQAFGEEFLLRMDSRQETAVANGFNTIVFALKSSMIAELEFEFGSLFDELHKSADEKFNWRQKKSKELFRAQENSSKALLDTSPKNHTSLFHSLPLLPLRDLRDVQSLYKPRHSIKIPYRRSFLLDRSPTHTPTSPFSRRVESLTFTCSSSSPTSDIFAKKFRKSSDDELNQHSNASETYKSQFGRTSVISELLRTAHVGRKSIFHLQVDDILPGSDLKTFNFRKELHGDSDPKHVGRFRKTDHEHLSQSKSPLVKSITKKNKKQYERRKSSFQNQNGQLPERNPKPRRSINTQHYLPTCEILKKLHKINVHWN